MTAIQNSGHPQEESARTRNSETPGATNTNLAVPCNPANGTVPNQKTRAPVSETPAPSNASADPGGAHGANRKRARARDSEKRGEPVTAPAAVHPNCPNHENARTRDSENQAATIRGSAEPDPYGTEAKSAHAPVSENSDANQPPLQVVAQRGDVTGDEQEFLANGFGYALRKLREMRGLTQHQVRGLAGISVGYLSMLERGQRRPTHDAIHAIVRALAPTAQQPELVVYFIKLSGDSIRESTARKKRRATSRAVVREAAYIHTQVSKMERQIDHLRATGREWLAKDLEKTTTALREQLTAREEAARAQLAAMGDNPDDPSITKRRTPKHFRKRSYGPRNQT